MFYLFIAVNNKALSEMYSLTTLPTHETLKDTIERAVPYLKQHIVPEIQSGKRIMVVAHGTSLRGLVKHIENLSQEDVVKLNLPTGIPFVYDLDRETLSPIKTRKYLADDKTVEAAVKKVASIGLKT